MQLFLFALICVGVLGSWDIPKLLKIGSISAYDVYVDAKSGRIHIMVYSSEKGTDIITYYQLDQQHHILQNKTISDERVFNYKEIKLTGAGNGKDLYVVLQGMFKHGRYSDNDQLFMESHDSGVTWSKMQPVPRKDMNDACQRTGGCILVVPETGRLFIFYDVKCAIKTRVLSYVTRPGNSSVFANEQVLREGYGVNIHGENMNAELTGPSGKRVVHLIWYEAGSSYDKVMYTSSADSGTTWTSPKTLTTNAYLYQKSLTSASRAALSPVIIGSYQTQYSGVPLGLFYSTNGGQDFTLDNATEGEQGYVGSNLHTAGMAICGTGVKQELYMFSVLGSMQYEYSVWDLKTIKRTVYPHPFTEPKTYGHAVRLGCYDGDKKISVTVLAVLSTNGTSGLYIAQDTLVAY